MTRSSVGLPARQTHRVPANRFRAANLALGATSRPPAASLRDTARSSPPGRSASSVLRSPKARRRRGFTLIELAIVLSISAVMVPLVFVFHRQLESAQLRAQGRLEAAAGAAAIAEELRRDTFPGSRSGPHSFVRAGCEVRYRLENRVLFRRADEACGGSRPVARKVLALDASSPGMWRVTFEHPLVNQPPMRITYVFAVGEPLPATSGEIR